MNYITLHNVTDIRTNKHHSIAIVKERLAKYFVSDTEETEEPKEELPEEPSEEVADISEE